MSLGVNVPNAEPLAEPEARPEPVDRKTAVAQPDLPPRPRRVDPDPEVIDWSYEAKNDGKA